jgi:hypothetical protein
MASANDPSVLKLDLTILWKDAKEVERTALVLAADRGTTFGALVELLIEHWDLPIWSQQDEPVAYDLYPMTSAVPFDLSENLTVLPADQAIRLRLAPASGRLVIAQSSAAIPVFEVQHPTLATAISVLALPAAITTAELRDKLEQAWELPYCVDEDPVYYELRSPDGQPLADKSLAELQIATGRPLVLAQVSGVKVEIPETTEMKDTPLKMEKPRKPEPPPKPSDLEFRTHLLEAMDEGLSEAEFEDLCFYLDEDDEQFTGAKRDRIRKLIQDYRRRHSDSLEGLVAVLCKEKEFMHIRKRLIDRGCQA